MVTSRGGDRSKQAVDESREEYQRIEYITDDIIRELLINTLTENG